jgi:PAS domain S-box-containing protein
MPQALSILIIEDSPEDAELLLHALGKGGYGPIRHSVVDSERTMRAAVAEASWDVITSDHSMPGFSAPEGLALAMALCPGVPFIIVSSGIELGLVISLMRSGTEDYVLKTQLARLPAVVERSLREARARREHLDSLAALAASETRYRRLFEAAQDGILIVDPQTDRIVDVNPFLMAMLGYAKDEFVGKTLWEIGAFKDTSASKSAFVELKSTGYVRYEDLPLVTHDGRQISVEFVSNLYLVGEEHVIQCNIRNITERKAADDELRGMAALLERRVLARTGQLEDVNKELEAFSYSVSHDLRAPLRQIDGFAHILQEDFIARESTTALDLVHRILVAAKRMNSLIDALLKMASGSKNELVRVPMDVTAMAHLVAADLSQGDPLRPVEWVIMEGAQAFADPELVHIVLDNLLGNAWKFTANRAAPRIELGQVELADGSAAWFVRDNGAGFAMSQAHKLFGAFRRLHGNKEFAGLGIGLATVQRIVHRHGGRIWAEGAVNEGATFWFTLRRPEQ